MDHNEKQQGRAQFSGDSIPIRESGPSRKDKNYCLSLFWLVWIHVPRPLTTELISIAHNRKLLGDFDGSWMLFYFVLCRALSVFALSDLCIVSRPKEFLVGPLRYEKVAE